MGILQRNASEQTEVFIKEDKPTLERRGHFILDFLIHGDGFGLIKLEERMEFTLMTIYVWFGGSLSLAVGTD